MASQRTIRIGVDVGGTNTDCVILDPSQASQQHRGILSTFKTPTTANVTDGITLAIRGAMSKRASLTFENIAAVMIGTTHFINAVVQADSTSLRKVAVLRVCGPYTKENPSFLDFPPILKKIINGHVAYLDGGLEFDGREIMAIDEDQIRKECKIIKQKGLTDIAICGVFSPLDMEGRHEARVGQIVQEEIPDADVVLSRDIGQLGFLERENATILNASILKFARKTIRGFKKSMQTLGLVGCPLFLTSNDGTIIDADAAERTPIKTFNSGPTNSMNGAAYLSGLDVTSGKKIDAQVIVADVGGTTCDICALLPSGFPRQAGTWVEIGNVRCMFPMPEVHSIALGGGTKIEQHGDKVIVGPESVGRNLLQEAFVFGGKTLTATDVVVACGKEQIGDVSRVQDIPEDILTQARLRIKRLLENAIDSMKISADDCVCIMVGGGSIVQMDDLKGVKEIIRPRWHDCANAVGAAIAKVSGLVDVVKVLESASEDEVLSEVCLEAKQRAIAAGADPDRVQITEIENLPLQYVQLRAARFIVKAAGPLSPESLLKAEVPAEDKQVDDAETNERSDTQLLDSTEKDRSDFVISASALISLADYRPEVDTQGRWWISEIDCEFLATGASVLACGGGGPGYMIYMAARDAIQKGGRMSVVDISALPDDTWILGNISYGAPTVTLERTPSGTEGIDATDTMLEMFPNVNMGAQIALEIGGMNAIRPMVTGLHYGVPTVDGDFMGRAYPRLYLKTPYLYDFGAFPCTQADGNGNIVTVNRAVSIPKAEKIHRKAGNELGLFSQLVIPPMDVKTAKKVACLGTTSLAWYIGRAVHQARQEKRDIMKAIVEANPSGKVLYTGKIVHVHRFVSTGGYTEGSVRLSPISSDEREYGDTVSSETRDLHLPFQNEYLIAELVDPKLPNSALHSSPEKQRQPDGEVLAMVPDLISLCGTDGYALGTQDLRYGVRVSVLAFTAHPHWYTPRGVATGGPKEFGFDIPFHPLGTEYYEPKRVMEEFRPR